MEERTPLPADFSDSEAVAAWLREQPREVSVTLAARAALRALPLALNVYGNIPAPSRDVILPLFRANLSSWLAVAGFNHSNDLRSAAAYAYFDDAGTDAYAYAAATHAAAACAYSDDANNYAAASYAYAAAAYANDRFANAAAYANAAYSDADAISSGDAAETVARLPLWHEPPTSGALENWANSRKKLIERSEGWEVWTDWYEARLRGDPFDLALEEARVLIPDARWQQGPKAVNAEIARLIVEHAAKRPSGERLDISPDTGRVRAEPALVEQPPVYVNARDKVADALEDFRDSRVANRAYGLNPVVRRIERAVTRYSDNPLRLHDDFEDCAREIARAVDADPDIDEAPVRALRDACGVGAIDLRNSVPEVAACHADRRTRLTRQPSARSASAATRLLQEVGEALEPELKDEMAEDAAIVSEGVAQDGEALPEGRRRDALLRLANRFAWLHQFAGLNAERIAALAARMGRSYEQVERVVNLVSGAKSWWEVIELIMRSM